MTDNGASPPAASVLLFSSWEVPWYCACEAIKQTQIRHCSHKQVLYRCILHQFHAGYRTSLVVDLQCSHQDADVVFVVDVARLQVLSYRQECCTVRKLCQTQRVSICSYSTYTIHRNAVARTVHLLVTEGCHASGGQQLPHLGHGNITEVFRVKHAEGLSTHQ